MGAGFSDLNCWAELAIPPNAGVSVRRMPNGWHGNRHRNQAGPGVILHAERTPDGLGQKQDKRGRAHGVPPAFHGEVPPLSALSFTLWPRGSSVIGPKAYFAGRRHLTCERGTEQG